MNVLITGSEGFIATKLTPLIRPLAKKNVGVDKKTNTSTVNMTMLLAAIKQFLDDKVDMIIHCGANCSTSRSIEDPASDFADNVIGTFNVCELARLYKAKVIFLSTCKTIPGDDGSRTPYGLSKLVGEQYLEEYSKTYGIEYIINRMGTIYGPGQDGSSESGWIGWFVKAAVESEPIIINGTGEQTRDILHVDDLCRLIKEQVEHFDNFKNRTFSIGGGMFNEISLLEVLNDVLEYKNYAHGKLRSGDAMRYVADLTEITKVSQWKPEINAREGILSTYNYYQEQKQAAEGEIQ